MNKFARKKFIIKQNKKEKMAKKTLIVVGVIIAVIIILALTAVIVTSAKSAPAVLYIEQGTVKVEHKGQWFDGKDEQELFLNDVVRTGEDSRASIVFYDSIITRLDSNTEIKIQKLSTEETSIKQAAGETWNKFENIAGVRQYEVETPNTAATVRGTGFLVRLNSILVGDGSVDVNLLKDGNRIMQRRVSAGEKILADIEKGDLILEKLTDEEKRALAEQIRKDRDTYKRVRLFLVKNDPKIMTAIRMAKLDESRIMEYAEKLDNGEYNEDEIYAKSPIKTENTEKILRLTKKIKAYNRLLNELQAP